MSTVVHPPSQKAQYRGLRMTADEYFALGETFERYELIDGVVCMSPSPTFQHQRIITEIAIQIGGFLAKHPIGEVAVEIDVRLSDRLVYRPDLIFLATEKAARCQQRVTEVPDVIVEVVSPDSLRMDAETKKGDYERFGVSEYWLIDPQQCSFTFHRLAGGKFTQLQPRGDAFESQAIAGFQLDVKRLRDLFR